MKLFKERDIFSAYDYAMAGGQALHESTPGPYPNTPVCFKRAKKWAHLFDQDEKRLTATALGFGVRVIKVSHRGDKRQHIDLCGKPLENAMSQAKKDLEIEGLGGE